MLHMFYHFTLFVWSYMYLYCFYCACLGNRMLTICPAEKSCGTNYPFWTNDIMPSEVGVANKVYAYGRHSDDCRAERINIEVMRCSWNTSHDFIYKYIPNDYYEYSCDRAFCGMHA